MTLTTDELGLVVEALEAYVDQLALTQDWGSDEEKEEAKKEADAALALYVKVTAHLIG